MRNMRARDRSHATRATLVRCDVVARKVSFFRGGSALSPIRHCRHSSHRRRDGRTCVPCCSRIVRVFVARARAVLFGCGWRMVVVWLVVPGIESGGV